jgi:hypothetical protein
MGNSTSTISAKNFDASRMPAVIDSNGNSISADNAVIFNVGVCSVTGFGNNSVVSLSLVSDGYTTQTGQTSSTGYASDKLLAKGFTFALDKNKIETAVLNLKLSNGNQVICERAIPVKTLKYSGAKYFTETLSFGMLDFPGKTRTDVPTVKMAFELLSVGNGKITMGAKHFMDLEVARGEGAGMKSHPLTMVR